MAACPRVLVFLKILMLGAYWTRVNFVLGHIGSLEIWDVILDYFNYFGLFNGIIYWFMKGRVKMGSYTTYSRSYRIIILIEIYLTYFLHLPNLFYQNLHFLGLHNAPRPKF